MKRKYVGVTAAATLCLGLLGWLVYERGPGRLLMGATLFRGFEQGDNFSRATEFFPVSTMRPPKDPHPFPQGSRIELPRAFEYEGNPIEVEEFLTETDTGALLVLQDGRIRYERYTAPAGPDVPWLSWSVAKSFVSALIGTAIDEGHIGSVEEPVSQHVPSLSGSGYDGVSIKDILQMSSGVAWDETYANPLSDVNRFGLVFFLGGSLNEFVRNLERARPPGTKNRYSSADTHVLGMLLASATGRSVTRYMEEKLWQPLGMESPGRWILDDEGVEMSFGGLNATARDYAKLGELYRLEGKWRGQQLIPSAWVHASTKPDAPHLMAHAESKEDYPVGYGYQWWIPAGDEGEFSAIGIYNQFIYVNPAHSVVIVKLSAFSGYALGLDEDAYRELQSFEFFRAIVGQLRNPQPPLAAP